MTDLYYWNTTLPATYKTTYVNPNDYFKTLKYKDDRFSAIFSSYQDILNQLNGVSSAEIGFDFQLYLESTSNKNVIGLITYVKHGTPAEKMGIKRGDMFRKINGQQMTTTNYSSVINPLLDTSASAGITFSLYQSGVFNDQTPVTVNKVTNYQEDPVYMDTVYILQSKKVGYLVYNFFSNDPGDQTLKYDLELNNAIAGFKQQNISELIVDLRYNHGGMMTSAVNLASMLVPGLTTDKIFAYTDYNQNYTDYFNSAAYKILYHDDPFITDFSTDIAVTTPSAASYPVQNVGSNLQRIFFLTGSNTASASEMVINGLKPFLTCVLVGDTTVGKNVGSTLVNDTKNTKNQWAMLPIILKYFNKDHKSDFTKGFVPDFLVGDDYSYQLGDIREARLATAISQITGIHISPAKLPAVKRTFIKSAIDFKPVHDGLVIRNKSIEGFLNQNKK
jgi:C-terminal processing protease CtpA/Prc